MSDVLDRFVVRRMVVLTNKDVVNTIQVGTSYRRRTTRRRPASKPRPLLVLANKQVVCDAWRLSAALCGIKPNTLTSDVCRRVAHCHGRVHGAAFKARLTDKSGGTSGNFHEADRETMDMGFKIASWKEEWKETNLNKDQRIFRKKRGRIVRWRSVLAPRDRHDPGMRSRENSRNKGFRIISD